MSLSRGLHREHCYEYDEVTIVIIIIASPQLWIYGESIGGIRKFLVVNCVWNVFM